MYILDTNAVARLMAGDPVLKARLAAVERSEVAMPGPVCAEFAYGLERLPRSKRRDMLRARYTLIRAQIAAAPWTDDVSTHFGAVKALLERRGRRLEDFDIAIAAHALATGAVLVTSDRKHMPRIPGLRVEDWSEAR